MNQGGGFQYLTLLATESGLKAIRLKLVVQDILLLGKIKHLLVGLVVAVSFQVLGQTLLTTALVLLLLMVAQEEKLVAMATPLVAMEVLLAVVVAGVQQVVEDTEALLQVYNVRVEPLVQP
jgi:uncharacterized oligopeptide transporter (OPT) family protein